MAGTPGLSHFWRIPAGISVNMAVPLSTTQFRSGLEAGSMAVLPASLRGGVYDCSVSGRECRWLPAFFCCRRALAGWGYAA